ncbi:hypothetical protein IWW38_002210, partial [Coemansia aciculifera]
EMTRATEVDQLPPPIETKCGDYVYFSRKNSDGVLVYYRRLAVNTTNSIAEQALLDSESLARDQGYVLRSLLISDNGQYMGCLAAKNESLGGGTESSSLLLYALSDTAEPK